MVAPAGLQQAQPRVQLMQALREWPKAIVSSVP
jgi:hypothetical protein